MQSGSPERGPEEKRHGASDRPQDHMRAGDHRHSPGRLTVVGLGPGSAELLAPQALAALDRAHAVVGYDHYVDLKIGRAHV